MRSRSITAAAILMVGLLAAIGLTAGMKTAARAGEKQTRPEGKHRVVIEVTREGPEQWAAALNYVENLRKAFGAENTEIEVVGHNAGLGMMLSKNAELAERMKTISDGGGVIFAACENSMKKKNVSKADLRAFVTTVDSGVAEVVRKQEAGWAYLKSGV